MEIAVVTGASSGMGREFVFAADREYDLDEIWVIARREERLAELAASCRAKIRVLAWDLTDRGSFGKYEDLLAELSPRIRLLVNAAGYGLFGAFGDLETDGQLGMADLNVTALTAMCRISLPYLQKGDAIVNIGSNSSWQPVPYMAVYAAGKAYVLSLSRALGRELKGTGIRVMCVCPGWVKTEFMDRAVRDDTVNYFDRWYTAQQVAERAMKDLKKGKAVSILGAPVRNQVRLVKHLPVDTVTNVWCRQQGRK
ncbi:MAG: SDR family NAD(P)-dependent oxidoreductase [Oscillospiraceae bacterium]|nr:SDR family NAD(P)-dependent oxidoreductase [Oscillospiraceae bacterium]